MQTRCAKCGRGYNDQSCWAICPHGPLEYSLDEYCPRCDTLRSLHGPCQHQQSKEQQMKLEDYIQLAMRTEANQEKIRHRVYELGARATRLDNACRGLVNDAAEVNNVIQVWLEYGKPLDQTHLLEELGDVMWRLAQICSEMNWSFEQIQQANIAKLKSRYPEKYSDEQADPDKRDRVAEKEAVATAKLPTKNPSNEINEMDVREQTGQGWAEPPFENEVVLRVPTGVTKAVITTNENEFTVARGIVHSYLDGKSAQQALRSIEIAEKKFKGE